MLRSSAALAAAVSLIAGCGGSGPHIQTGPGAVKTPDGLHRVDGVSDGTLYMKPDYAFGSYDQVALGETAISYERGSQVLEGLEVRQIVSIFEAVARELIEKTGRTTVSEPGPCVALVSLALVDLDLERGPHDRNPTGALTLVLEVRDGHTREPLLRYGQRRTLGGVDLASAFGRYADRFQRDLERSLPKRGADFVALSCSERAGS